MGWDGVYDESAPSLSPRLGIDVHVHELLRELLASPLFASPLVIPIVASLVLGLAVPCVLLCWKPTTQFWLRALRRRSGLRETRLFAGGIHYAALEKGGVEGSETVLFLHDMLTDKDVWHDVCSHFPDRFHLLGLFFGRS